MPSSASSASSMGTSGCFIEVIMAATNDCQFYKCNSCCMSFKQIQYDNKSQSRQRLLHFQEDMRTLNDVMRAAKHPKGRSARRVEGRKQDG
jgi:hypothetical protein